MTLETVAVPLDVDHLTVMEETVQDGRGNHLVAEEVLPFSKAFIRCDDH